MDAQPDEGDALKALLEQIDGISRARPTARLVRPDGETMDIPPLGVPRTARGTPVAVERDVCASLLGASDASGTVPFSTFRALSPPLITPCPSA